jgi:hypothetical protein
MADTKLGEGRKTSDRRGHGAGDNQPATIHGGDNLGDRRKLKGIQRSSGESRAVPVAETVGGDLKKGSNGSGTRATPASMKLGEL